MRRANWLRLFLVPFIALAVSSCHPAATTTSATMDGQAGVTNGGLTAAYDYEYEGGRWTELDASGEPPFAQAMGQRLVGWESLFNGVNEVVGIKLNFDGTTLTLEVREGEVTT